MIIYDKQTFVKTEMFYLEVNIVITKKKTNPFVFNVFVNPSLLKTLFPLLTHCRWRNYLEPSLDKNEYPSTQSRSHSNIYSPVYLVNLFNNILSFRRYKLSENLFFGVFSFCSSYIIAGAIKRYVDKTKKESIILFILMIIMISSMILMPTYLIIKSFVDPSNLFKFTNIC